MLVNVILSPKGGGAELLVRELHKIHIGHGLNAKVIYFDGDSEGLKEGEEVLGVSYRSPLNVFRLRRRFKKLLDKSNGELIIHAHLTWPFFYVALASFGLPHVKLVYTEHNTTNKRRSIPLFWVLERFFYSRYSRVICISQGVHDTLAEWVGPRIAQRLVTIPNGSRIYSLAKRQESVSRLPRLVSVGSLSSRKNFVTAISAISLLKDDIDTYAIIGEGPERSQLENIIWSEKLEDKVKLLGWSDGIEAHLHAADIQLIPSLWEGFGLVAVEGMSTGLPVVASNVDGLREVLGESNPSITLVNQPQSVDEWVSAIRQMIARIHEQGSDSLARSSRKQAEKFTLNKMAEKYLEVYRHL